MKKQCANVLWMVFGVFVVFALVSCDNFYSTSWGKERDYDVSKIKLTSGNLQDWKEKAAGNPELAAALVKKIIGELESKSGAEKVAFQKVGVELAIEQAGIGTKIIELAGSKIDSIDSEDGMKDLLSEVQSGLDDVDGAAKNIAAIVGKSTLTSKAKDSTPGFATDDPYAAQASASDVGMAVMVLALSIIPDIKNEGVNVEDIDKLAFTDDNPKKVKVIGDPPTPEEIALAAYLNLIATDDSGTFDDNIITKGIKDAFLGSGGEK